GSGITSVWGMSTSGFGNLGSQVALPARFGPTSHRMPSNAYATRHVKRSHSYRRSRPDPRGKCFKAGVIMCTTGQTTPLGARLWAVPPAGLCASRRIRIRSDVNMGNHEPGHRSVGTIDRAIKIPQACRTRPPRSAHRTLRPLVALAAHRGLPELAPGHRPPA